MTHFVDHLMQFPFLQRVTDIRRDFHRHPELGMMENRTTHKIKAYLSELGIPLQRLPNLETGAVGILGADTGTTIGLRADIDALPMEERNDVPYKSLNKDVMHACGHDCHTAILLGLAGYLVESGMAQRLKGQVKLIFQPGEETLNGARAVMDAGVMQNPAMDAIYALHMTTVLPTGRIGLFKTVSHAAADKIELEIIGKGGHGAHPETALDPIASGAAFILAAQSIKSQCLPPSDGSVISICEFHSGSAMNIIPETARLSGTVRTFNETSRQLIQDRLHSLVKGLQESFGVKTRFNYIKGVPVNRIHKDPGNDIYKAAVSVVGKKNVQWIDPTTGSEDFAFFSQAIPAAYAVVGCRNSEKGMTAPNHSPFFDADEQALEIGIALLIEIVRLKLEPDPHNP